MDLIPAMGSAGTNGLRNPQKPMLGLWSAHLLVFGRGMDCFHLHPEVGGQE